MTSRRGIFFNSKARINEKLPSLSTNSLVEDSNNNSSSSNTDQLEPPPMPIAPLPATTMTTTSVKKKIILNHTKRTLAKTNYSGPRKIFSTNYKANRTQLNHKAFFGGNTDEYDIDNSEPKSTKTVIQLRKTKIEQKITVNRPLTSCAELDETQSYIDDMEYYLTGMQAEKLLAERCLSAIKFAELCLKSSFRTHLRTEKTLDRIFNLLQDAPDISSLNICTAFIFYILSSDTLASELNPNLLHLILNLVNKSSTINPNEDEYQKMKEKISTLNKNAFGDEIFYESRFNTCDIILETFVNLSHNTISESMQNEMRTLGGFDMIIDAINSIVQDLSNNDFECYSLTDLSKRIKKVCRFINLLEELSNENSEQASSNTSLNRNYIVRYHQYSLFHSLSKLLDLSLIWMQQHSDSGDIFRDGCKTIMSILVILTNDSENNCDRLSSDDRFFSNLFRLLVYIEKSSFTNEEKFDTIALTLNLLINLVQNTKHIYKHLMEENMPGNNSLKIYEYIARLFCEQESSAARAESHEENDWMMEDVNDDFDDDEDDEQIEKKNTNENGTNFNRALQKATGHMENTFVAAFAGVILAAILLRDQTTYAQQIRDLMPQKKFDTMAFILKKFFVFMHMSHAFTPSGVKTLEELISLVLSLCG